MDARCLPAFNAGRVWAIATAVVAAMGTFAVASPPIAAAPEPSAQGLNGFHVREAFSDREDGWNDHDAELWFAPDAFRLDLWNRGNREATWGSLILSPQERSSVLEIHHFSSSFDRCPIERFALVQGGPLGSWPFDPEVARFEVLPFDEVRQVASWSTEAVAVREPGPNEEWVTVPGNPRGRVRRTYDRSVGRLWLTEDIGMSLDELSRVLADSLRPYADAGGSWFVLHSMWLHTILGLDPERLPGLPPGIPVAFEFERLGELGVTGELRSIERAILPASLFEAPAGYTGADLCPGG